MSDPAEEEPKFNLHIDAHALLQLGEQLISDDAQALLELVKNSYDADAGWAHIKIDSRYIPTLEDPAPESALGLIEVKDNGVGMDLSALQQSWLRISFSFKRQQKASLKRSKRFKRLPIGDKGLGRLGTMRLGSYLSVETYIATNKPGWMVTFHWADIQSGKPLESVPVSAVEIPASGEIGTTVRIFGLRDLPGWKKQKRIRELRTKLCGLISPFDAFRDFDVELEVDGDSAPLEAITKSLRETATIRFDYDWDGTTLNITGKIKLIWFRKDPIAFDQFINPDKGTGLRSALFSNEKIRKSYGLEPAQEGGWFLTMATKLYGSDLNFELNHGGDPGPFKGSLDYFDLGGTTELPKNVFDKRGDYQNIVKELAQLYIYRDGFGVGMNKDWLSLGSAWTGAKGYYSLKPGNVIGFFAISVEKNSKLEEKSDREGFIDNAAWRGFFMLAGEIKKYINNTLNALGRGTVKFLKEKTGEHSSAEESEHSYGELVTKLESILDATRDLEQSFRQNSEDRRNAVYKIGGAARMLWVDAGEPKGRRAEAKKVLDAAERIVPLLDADYQQVEKLLSELQSERTLAAIIRRRIEEFEERSQQLYDMVAVGLSAQALAHDVPAILIQISDNAKALLKLAQAVHVDSAKVRLHAESIDASVAGVSDMIEFVKPMLRGKRLARQKAMVSEFVNNYYALRGARLRVRNIHWYLEREGMRDFRITFNAGRMIQILDNLTTNSEYWIDRRSGSDKGKGRITLTIDDPELRFWDNGPGIRPDLEESLFDLFTSGKPVDEGNGLGLFITQQLLLRDNCTITLDPARNESGRLFRFVINFSGAKTTAQ